MSFAGIAVALFALVVFLSPQLIIIKLLMSDKKDIYAHAAEDCDPEKINDFIGLNKKVIAGDIVCLVLKIIMTAAVFVVQPNVSLCLLSDMAITALTAAAGVYYIVKKKRATKRRDRMRVFAFVMMIAALTASLTAQAFSIKR